MAYLAAWDFHRAKVFARCEVKSGIAPVDRLVAEVSPRCSQPAPQNCRQAAGSRSVTEYVTVIPNVSPQLNP